MGATAISIILITMSLSRLNHLNIGLMILSLSLAYLLPFELFLFSYAILGPAHYLTEISWLHDRRYFCSGKYDYLWLVGFSLLILAGSSYVIGSQFAVTSLGQLSTEIIFAAFGLALILVLSSRTRVRVVAFLVLLAAIALFRDDRWTSILFALYLPTLIHVYIFTGAFILFGALKSHSKSGYLSFVIFIGCALACLVITPDWSYSTSEYVRNSYAPFSGVSARFALDFGLGDIRSAKDIYFSEAGQTAMRFIAFAYTYHYLNWFSKTSVIRWHAIPKSRYLGICLLWLVSISLYIYDYSLGFRWLFLLSFAHVFLEFPLNHQSFIGIGRQLRRRLNQTQPLQA